MSIVHIVTAVLLVTMMFLQARNFFRYRKTNGANYMRILIFISTSCMLIHTIRLSNGGTEGSFLLASVITYLSIYFKSEA